MKRSLLFIAALALVGCARQGVPSVASQAPAASTSPAKPGEAAPSTGPGTATTAGDGAAAAGTGVGTPASAPCRPSPVIYENLKKVAATSLPVQTVFVSIRLDGGLTSADQFAQTVGAPPTADGIRAKEAAGETWAYTVDGNQVKVIETTTAGGEQRWFEFPKGELGASPTLEQVMAQLQKSLPDPDVQFQTVTAADLNPAPTQMQFYFGPLDMVKWVAQYPNNERQNRCGAWQPQPLPVLKDGKIQMVQTMMLDVANGGFLGFGDGKFFVRSLHAGVDAIDWFTIPGLQAVPVSGQ